MNTSTMPFAGSINRNAITTTVFGLLAFGFAATANSATNTNPLATPIHKVWDVGSGWFGAKNTLDISETNSAGVYTLKAIDEAVAELIKKSIRLAKFEGRLGVSSATSQGTLYADISIAGQRIAHLDEKFASAKTWKTTPITRQISTGSLHFSVFGLPASISGSASASGWAEAKASLDPVPSGRPALHANGGPVVDLAVHATGQINAVIISGGVSGDVSLLKEQIAADVKYTPASKEIAYGVVNTFRGADGSVSAWVKIRILFWTKKWSTTLWSSSAKAKSETLTGGTVKL